MPLVYCADDTKTEKIEQSLCKTIVIICTEMALKHVSIELYQVTFVIIHFRVVSKFFTNDNIAFYK